MLEVIGANHKTSPLEVRERLAVSSESLPEALKSLKSACDLSELAILSTCNRVEFYFQRPGGGEQLGHHLAAIAGLSREAVRASVYHLKGDNAIRHLFCVAAGLDSMALGETEVLSQCKSAYEAALGAGTTGGVLNPLFQRAFGAAKRVHSVTGVSKGKTSIGSVSLALVTREIGDLTGAVVLVVGAGAMAENALAHITTLGTPKVVIANRSRERSRVLAERFSGETVGLNEVGATLASAQVVITSTSGAKFLLTQEMVAKARKRSAQPLFLLDLSVPRNVEPSVGKLAGVKLFNIDDLKDLADAARTVRKKELDKATVIIDEEVALFNEWMASQQVMPVVRALKEKAARLEEREVAAALKNIEKGASPEAQIRILAKRLTSRLLHDPLCALKGAARSGDEVEALACAARKLHGIGENGQSEESGK